MSRRRMSKAEGQALAALVVAMCVVAAALVVAMAKAVGAILRWIWVTGSDLTSDDPSRIQRGRARVATVGSALIVVAGYAVVVSHTTRTVWHEAHASWEPLGFVMAVAVGSFLFLIWRVATGFGATIPWRYALGTLVPALAVAAVVWGVDRPTLASAQAQLHASQFDAARITARALVSLDGPSPAVSSLFDRIHEREVLGQRDLEAALVQFRGPWHDPSARARVAATLYGASVRDASALVARNAADRLDALASAADALPDVARMFRARAMVVRLAERPRDSGDCPATDLRDLRPLVPEGEYEPRAAGVRARVAQRYRAGVRAARGSHGHSHGTALQAWTAVRETGRCLEQLGDTAADPSLAEIDARLTDLTTQQRQAEAAVERQREREAQQAERRERRRSRRGGGRSEDDDDSGGGRCGGRVLCCDGSCSPSCGLNRSSFRGCCSHHGGICG